MEGSSSENVWKLTRKIFRKEHNFWELANYKSVTFQWDIFVGMFQKFSEQPICGEPMSGYLFELIYWWFKECHCLVNHSTSRKNWSFPLKFHSFLRIWSHLLKKSLMESLIFCAVQVKSDNDENNKDTKSSLLNLSTQTEAIWASLLIPTSYVIFELRQAAVFMCSTE